MHHTIVHTPRPARAIPAATLSFAVAAFTTITMLAQANPARAAGPEPDAGGGAPLANIVVTATRTPKRVDDQLADTTIVDREAIERASGRSLGEVLALQPGIQAWSSGGPCQTTSVSIRGLEGRHVLLLVDGVRYGSATLGTPVWDTIPLDSIERIEIVRGPMSAMYGSDAVAGVIQIFTRGGRDGVHGNASLMAGTLAAKQASAGVQFGNGTFDGAVQVTGASTRGKTATSPDVPYGSFNGDGDGCHGGSVSARAGWALGAGWRADGNVMQARRNVRYDDGPDADARARLDAGVYAIQLAGPVWPVSQYWRTSLRIAQSRDAYDTLVSASDPTSVGTIATRQQQFSWENTLPTPVGRVMWLAEYLRQSVSRPGDAFEVASRSIRAVGIGLDGSAGIHHWQGGLRHDDNSQYGGKTTGSVGYGIDVVHGLRLSGSYGTSFVAPSFNQLYYPGYGNPLLQPETGRTAEVALQWNGGGAGQWRLSTYRSHIRGFITDGAGPVNVPRSVIDGVTLSWAGAVGPWDVNVSGDHVDPRQRADGAAGGATTSAWLPRRARNMLRASLDRDWNGWRFGATALAFSGRYDDTANKVRLGGGATLDLRAERALSRDLRVALYLNDLADRRITTVAGYPAPGRRAFVALRWRMS